jgi:hypothetical protein
VKEQRDCGEDHPRISDDDLERILRLASESATRTTIRLTSHQNHEKAEGTTWEKWIVTLCGGLILISIPAAVVMYGKLSAIEANQINQQRQIEWIITEIRRK